MRNKKNSFNFGYILLLTLILLFSILIIYGFYEITQTEYQGLSLIELLTNPILANKNYTLIGTLTDFDRQLADVVYNIMISLLFAGVILKYDTYKKDNHDNHQNQENQRKIYQNIKKSIIILSIICLIYVIFVFISSYLNIGWSWIELNGRNILLEDFYNLYFSTKIPTLVLLYIGGASFWYLLFRRHFNSEIVSNPKGNIFILFSLILFNIRFIFSPLEIDYIFNNTSLIYLINTFFQELFIFSIILIIQSRFASIMLINSNTPTESTFHAEKEERTIKTTNKTNKIFWISFLISFFGFILYTIVMIILEPWVSLNVGYILLGIPNIIFGTLLTILFYFIGILWRDKNE